MKDWLSAAVGFAAGVISWLAGGFDTPGIAVTHKPVGVFRLQTARPTGVIYRYIQKDSAFAGVNRIDQF